MVAGDQSITYSRGIPEAHAAAAAQLYESAFGEKFSLAIKAREQRVAIIQAALDVDYCFSASAGVSEGGSMLVGLAGFHSAEGSLTGGIGAGFLLRKLGLLKGSRACAVFGIYHRDPEPQQLLMDGIAVHKDYRGRGIGSRLLDLLIAYARENGFQTIRLDVIDTNPKARQLYEKKGFVAVRSEKYPYLRWLLGFGGSTTMEYRT